jgi:hypothetical protein
VVLLKEAVEVEDNEAVLVKDAGVLGRTTFEVIEGDKVNVFVLVLV